jgi:hypothetical protein
MNTRTAAVGRAALRVAAALAAAGLAGLWSGPGYAAAARPTPGNDGFPVPSSQVVVRRVQVPVDDTRAEITQMALAAAGGAVLAGALASGRRRRRTEPTPAAPARLVVENVSRCGASA